MLSVLEPLRRAQLLGLYLPQSDGGRHWVVVELGALWLWVKALWWLLGAIDTGTCSVSGPASSGSWTKQVFIVGLEAGVPWAGGDGHGDPRGDMLDGGKPKNKLFPIKLSRLKQKLISSKLSTNTHLVFPVVCCRGGWKCQRQCRRLTWSGSLRWLSLMGCSMNHRCDERI